MISVEYVDHMGSDLRTVDAARASFDKTSDWEYEEVVSSGGVDMVKRLSVRDKKLVGYLGKHRHWTTSAHNQLTLRITLPIWLSRQFTKHQVGAVVNEVSRRYVDTPPEVWYPKQWRARPIHGVKQGSGQPLDGESQQQAIDTYVMTTDQAVSAYDKLLALGVAPEQARSVLPQGICTTLYVTGSLVYWARMYNQRCGHEGHPQAEWREITDRLTDIASRHWPYTWRSLVT